MHRAPRLTLTAPNKAARRVIAPYVKIIRRGYKAPIIPENIPFQKQLEKRPTVLLKDLSGFLSDDVDLSSIFHESADVLKVTTKAFGVSLYFVMPATNEIYQSQRYFNKLEPRVRFKIGANANVSAHVAHYKETVMIDDVQGDERFPMGIGQQDAQVKSVLSVPVVTSEGECFAVIELFKRANQDPFTERDLKIVSLITEWMGAAIYQNTQRIVIHKKQELNNYLLKLTEVFLEENIPVKKMISEMVLFLRLTLGSEMASFYLLDSESEQLEADVYETELDGGIQKTTKIKLTDKERHIAATVLRTGKFINVKEPLSEYDSGKSSFVVRSALCMAVKGLNEDILGIIEVTNKKNGVFMNSDEVLLEVFAIYFSLVIHFGNVSNQLKYQEKLNSIHLSLLSRQMAPCTHDIEYLMSNLKIQFPNTFTDFKWYLPEDSSEDITILVFGMMKEICEPGEIIKENLAKFILSLKNFESELPFHNFEHVFCFTHCLYNILKRNRKYFSNIEIKALMVTALGHCTDRTYLSNEILALTQDDIWKMYPKSSWQHYHYLIVTKLLEAFPIFRNSGQDDEESFLQELKECMLNTDLRTRVFGKALIDLWKIVDAGEFNHTNQYHHYLLKILCLTCSYFSMFSKSYVISRRISEKFYHEILDEGKLFKKAKPNCILMSIFDSSRDHSMAELQIHHLDVFVLLTAFMLKIIFPNTADFYDNIWTLRKNWQDMIGQQGRRVWKAEDSYVKKKLDL